MNKYIDTISYFSKPRGPFVLVASEISIGAVFKEACLYSLK